MTKKILVVDDDEDIVKIMKIRLANQGYEVITAYDGQQAYDIIQKNTPDLIVADLVMPNLNGWILTQMIKNHDQYKTIPIILLSAIVAQDSTPKADDLGDYYMSKPFSIDKLIDKIHELLEFK